MPFALSLGDFEHTYSRKNLKLKTCCWTTISSPQASLSPFSQLFKDPERLLSSGTWVSRGYPLLLRFNLSFESFLFDRYKQSSLVENIGLVLCSAELWSQFGLEASLDLSLVEDDDFLANEVILTLAPRNNLNVNEALNDDFYASSNVGPPIGVPYACLDAVILDLSFSRRPCAEKTVSELNSLSLAANGPGIITGLELLDQSDWPLPSSRKCPARGVNQEVEMLDQYLSASSPSVTISEKSASSQLSFEALANAPNLHTPLPEDIECPREQSSIEDFVKLMDISLRSTIQDLKLPKRSGLEISSTTVQFKLSTFAPVIFRPGYLEAVSQRYEFIPIIAGSLLGFYHHTASATLKRKIEQMQNISPERWLSDNPSSSQASGGRTSALLAAISARLWFLAQTKLIDPSSPRGLKPLPASEGICEAYVASQQMLDEDSVWNDDIAHSDLDPEADNILEERSMGGQLPGYRSSQDKSDELKTGFLSLERGMLQDEELLKYSTMSDDHFWSILAADEDLFVEDSSALVDNLF